MQSTGLNIANISADGSHLNFFLDQFSADLWACIYDDTEGPGSPSITYLDVPDYDDPDTGHEDWELPLSRFAPYVAKVHVVPGQSGQTAT